MTDLTTAHLATALKVIQAWEELGMPGPHNEDNLRIVSHEVATLESLAAAHPLRSDEIEPLAERYRMLRRTLQG